MGFTDSFRLCAESWADRTAIVDNGATRKTSYAELDRLSGCVAGKLHNLGCNKGDFILVNIGRCMEYIAAYFGILKAGCVVVPVIPEYPQKRLDYIISDCEAKLVITSEFFSDIDEFESFTDSANGAEPAVLTYTSGSTGSPKGILLSSADLLRATEQGASLLQGVEPLVHGAGTQFTFILHILEYLSVLLSGGVCHILDDTVRKGADTLSDYYSRNGITTSIITPAILRFFHNRGHSLKRVITVGERVSGVAPEGYELVNLYAMTETVGVGAIFNIDRPYENTPIGKGMEGVTVNVMNSDGKPLTDGTEGEICIIVESDTVYFKDPERTAQTFCRLPDGRTLIHTSDIGYVNGNGDLVYSNRKDRMVKINGQRVEPGEVEYAMNQIDGIERAIVTGFTDQFSSSTYLVGYYKLTPDSTIKDDQIRDSLLGCLAPYMVPRFFCRVDSIPLNTNGKIDISSLPKVEVGNYVSEYAAPESETEKALCDAFSKVLGLSQTGLDDDFFLLGGDSIRVMSLTQEYTGHNLTSTMVFQARTPRGIAQLLEKSTNNFVHSAPGDAVPLTKMQAGIFYECMRNTWEKLYNNAFLFKLGDGVDLQRLCEALQKAVKAHPVLSANIYMSEDGTAMMRWPEETESPEISIENISEQSMDVLKESMSYLKGELLKPSDIQNNTLFKIRVFRSPDSKYLFCDFHHIIFDGTSMHIFLQDVDAAYNGFPLAKEKVNGFELAMEEHNARNGEEYTKAREWYERTFAEMNSVSLPSPTIKLPEKSFDSLSLPLDLSAEELNKRCRTMNVTPNVLTTAAFGYLLAAYTSDSRSSFVIVYNGRKDARTERTVGMLVKALPVFCNPGSAKSIPEYLEAVKTQLLGSMANDIYSFSDFATGKGIGSDVIFTYQGDMFEMPSIGGEALTDEKFPFNATGEILSVDVLEYDGQLEIKTDYRSDMYDEQFILQFSRCYRNVLRSMMNSAEISGITLLDDEMRSAVTALSTGETMDIQSETLVSLIAAQARKTPEAIALADGNGATCTYAQLDEVSSSVAAKLLSKGVQPGDFVCLATSRSKEFVMAALGVMKAGAAYVPLDMEYPEERLKFMREDCGAKVVIDFGFFSDLSATAPFVDKSTLDGPAYMIYTSGSTGKPKGVVVQHQALSNFTQSIAKLLHLSPRSRISCHSSFSFDASIEDLFPALTVGGSVWIVPEDLRKNLSGLYKFIVSNRITGGNYTTQFGVSLLEFYPDLPVEYLVVGGEYLSSRPKSKCRLINTYGPTEFTVDATYKELSAETDLEVIPIGRPMPNCCAWILDRMGGLAPQGIVGEICLSGSQIAAGYWNRDEMTASRFKAEKCLPGVVLYHTGDLGRYNAMGELEYSGRIDSQIKLRGFRIETGEIDSRVSHISGVHSSITGVRTLAGRDTLCTWFIGEDSVSPETISRALAGELPHYMIPDVITKVDSFPHLPNGKIDTKALPVNSSDLRSVGFKAPESENEKILCNILSSMTGIERIGVNDDLINDTGISSLQIIKFVYLAEQSGIRISVSDIYTARTVQALLRKEGRTFVDFIESENPAAPIVLFVSGYVPCNPYFDETFEYMKKDYSILVFDQFINNFDAEDLVQTLEGSSNGGRRISIDALMDDYWSVINEYINKKRPIAFIMGVCFGADIAFALANRVLRETGKAYPLMAFDPIYERNKYLGIPEIIRDNASLVEKYSISDELSRTMQNPSYEGKCTFFFPTQELFQKLVEMPDIPLSDEEIDEFRKEKNRNEELFRTHFPDSEFNMLAAHHFNLVSAEQMPVVLDLIAKSLK